MPKSLSDQDLLPPSSLLCLTDVQQTANDWIVKRPSVLEVIYVIFTAPQVSIRRSCPGSSASQMPWASTAAVCATSMSSAGRQIQLSPRTQ